MFITYILDKNLIFTNLYEIYHYTKNEALDHTMWRTHFGRLYECAIRQTTE